MNLSLAFQHVLSTPPPLAIALNPAFIRELRGRMRLAALRWQLAHELGECELAEDCLANAIQWRNAGEDCLSISLRGSYEPARGGASSRPSPAEVCATILCRRSF